jgi:hypothetical protein
LHWFSTADPAPIIFSKELLDTNDAFDPSTGIFEAPFAGLYQFTMLVFENALGSTHWFGIATWSPSSGTGPTVDEVVAQGGRKGFEGKNKTMHTVISTTLLLDKGQRVAAVF